MSLLTDRKFSFVSRALPEDTFSVIHFTGYEGLSRLYEFEISLVSENPDIDLDQVLAKPAQLVIHREDGEDVYYNGILQQFEQQQEFQGYVFYRVVLSPRLWWLTLTHHNQVCLGESVQTFVENTLADGGLTADDYEFRLKGSYPEIEYVCQYGESHFNFISRWLEREGIYYYFAQESAGEKLIITDAKSFHGALPQGRDLVYSPPSGLDSSKRNEIIRSLSCRQRPLPRKVILRDFNLERPSLEVTGEADVDPLGRGESYLYGERFPTPEEGKRLAGIRAEELLCRKQEFFGESTVPYLLPGFLFTLKSHYRDSFNRDYLIEEVTHEGNQAGYLISGLGEALTQRERTVFYRNSFKAVPAGVQYRPERKAEKPRIAGTMHARVDAEGSGKYAEMDDHGRYKVRLPFDVNSRHGAGKASSCIRMAEPYSGADRGMHFPLLKGTEVLLTFIDGDPDRPFISGTVPSPETPSVVNSACNTSGGITDGSNNFIMHNSSAGQRITMTAGPGDNSAFFSIGTGSPNGAISQSDYESRNSFYYTNAGIVSSIIGGFGQSMVSQALLWAIVRLISKHICDTILEHDRIGKKTGSIDNDEGWNGTEEWHMALLAGGPILFNMILTAQMTKSLAQHLITTGVARSMANFGPATIKEQVEKEATAGWFRRCVDRIKSFGSGVGGAVNANILGWSGTYGILIFNNTSSLSHGIADPTAGTAVKLNPFNPDVLVASGWGYVDIDAGKSVNLHAAEDVVAEGKTVRIDAADKTVIQAGSVGKSSLVMEGALAFSKITMESGSSKISLTGGDETLSPRIILMAQRYPMNLLLTQSIEMDDISTTIGGSKPTTGFIRIDNMGIAMETKAATVKITPVGAVELKPVLKYTCNALGDVEIWGAKGVQVFSNAKTYLGGTAIDIGNNLTAQANVVGKLIKIGDGSGICQIKGANIQLG